MAKNFTTCVFIVLMFIILNTLLNTLLALTTINVITFEAKPNGVKDSTQAFLNAWTAACASDDDPFIFVLKGRYRLGPLAFKGP